MTDTENTTPPGWTLLFATWVIASIATAGSLFFSMVMDLPPCVLCWYQRIALFPLVLILPAGLLRFDRGVVRYALPLAISGWAIAAYHNALYFGLIPASVQRCEQGVSCTERHLELFGFLDIPLLSLIGFSAIITLLVALHRKALA